MRGWPVACDADRVGLRCLLVDDNTALLEAMRLLLEREGVTVVGMASSTAEALRQASALCPDVVLVDIALGDENGFDLVRRLAHRGSCGQITVIMISTRSEADYAELITESPAAGFLPKAELSAAAIRRILGRSA
jgi:DNA-binding NarL/FixJ family response regulator